MTAESGVVDLWPLVSGGALFRSHADRNRIEAYIPPAGRENHAPNFAILPDGEVLCAWFAGQQEGMAGVKIALSRLPAGGAAWTAPVFLSDDPQRSEQNPILFTDPDGCLRLWHTAQLGRGCSEAEWNARVARGEAQGMFVRQGTAVIRQRVSADGGQTWGPAETLFDRPGSFCRHPPVLLGNGDWLFPMYYSPDDASAHLNDWTAMQVSADGGRTWAEHAVPDSRGFVHASVVEWEPGRLVAFFRSRRADRIHASRSSNGGRTWSAPRPTSLPNNNSSIQARRLASGALAIVFNRFSAAGSAPADQAVWPQERYPVSIALSEDGGETWPWVRDIEPGEGFCGERNRGLNRQEAYPCIAQDPGGMIHVAFSHRGRQCIQYVRFPEAWARNLRDEMIF